MDDEKRPKPFSTAKRRIAHGFEQLSFRRVIGAEDAVENLLDLLRRVPQCFFKRQQRRISQYSLAPFPRRYRR